MDKTPYNWMVLLVWPECEKVNYLHPCANGLLAELCLVVLLLLNVKLLGLLLYSFMGQTILGVMTITPGVNRSFDSIFLLFHKMVLPLPLLSSVPYAWREAW